MGQKTVQAITTVLSTVLLAASAVAQPIHTPGGRPEEPPPVQVQSSGRLPRATREALQTIYYYAHRSDDPRSTRKFKSRDLMWAIGILRKDSTEGATERRNLAVAKLVGGARVVDGHSAQKRLAPHDLSDAIRLLTDSAFSSQIVIELEKLGRSAPRFKKEDAAFGVLRRTPSAHLQQVLWPVAFTVGSLGSDASCGQVIRCDDPTVDENGVVHLGFEILVRRPFAAVKRALDPQVWDTCNATYFENVYVAKQSHTGNVPVSPCPGDPVTVDGNGDAGEDADAPPLGGEHNPFVLFEHFQVDNVLGGALFKNLLCITPTVDDKTYQFNYRLIKSIDSRVGDQNELQPGGIKVDEGFVRVVDDEDGQSSVTAMKSIQFEDPELNEFTRLVLGGMCLEVAGQLPGTGACCSPNAP